MKKRDYAQRLRTRMTVPEKRLWTVLRARTAPFRFEAQVPIGPFFADFVCREARLVVEVDGPHHGEGDRDVLRDAALAGLGWEVARYWNRDVMTNLEGVLHDVMRRVSARSRRKFS